MLVWKGGRNERYEANKRPGKEERVDQPRDRLRLLFLFSRLKPPLGPSNQLPPNHNRSSLSQPTHLPLKNIYPLHLLEGKSERKEADQ